MKTMLSFLAVAAVFSSALIADDAKPAAPVENVSPDQAEKLIKETRGLVVIDVRTPDEFAEGHIPGAKNVDFFDDDFAKKMAALDQTKPVLIHCAAGNRSSQALKAIAGTAKFPAIYHLKAGFSGWKAAKKPVEGGNSSR